MRYFTKSSLKVQVCYVLEFWRSLGILEEELKVVGALPSQSLSHQISYLFLAEKATPSSIEKWKQEKSQQGTKHTYSLVWTELHQNEVFWCTSNELSTLASEQDCSAKGHQDY